MNRNLKIININKLRNNKIQKGNHNKYYNKKVKTNKKSNKVIN